MMLTYEIIVYMLLILSVVYVIIGLFSISHIKRYDKMAIDVDYEHIARSPFQPSVSIVVCCDLNLGDINEKIWKLVTVNYVNYEVIVVCNSHQNPEAFQDMIKGFGLRKVLLPISSLSLTPAPRGMYKRDDAAYHTLVVIDKAFRSVDDYIYTGVVISEKDYIVPVRSINEQLERDSLASMAVMAMRNRNESAYEVRGISRYLYDKESRNSPLLYMCDLTNLRRIYMGGFILDNNLCQSGVMYSRDIAPSMTEFVPKRVVRMKSQGNLATYFRELTPNYANLSYYGRCFIASEVLLSSIFLFSLVVAVVPSAFSSYFALVALGAYLLILFASVFSIFAAEVFCQKDIRCGTIIGLLAISFVESLFFRLFMPFTYIRSLIVREKTTMTP